MYYFTIYIIMAMQFKKLADRFLPLEAQQKQHLASSCLAFIHIPAKSHDTCFYPHGTPTHLILPRGIPMESAASFLSPCSSLMQTLG